MLFQLFIGGILVVFGTVLHIVALDRITTHLRAFTETHVGPLGTRLRLTLISLAALGIFVSHVVQIWVWAAVYLGLGEVPDMETALYFSTVVFTTLGFGDLLASPEWRLLASCEAAAGLLLFGVSTAVLFEVLREVGRRGGRWTPGAE